MKNDKKRVSIEKSNDKYAVIMKNASFSWFSTQLQIDICLKELNLKIEKGKLIAILGKVGSDKSSLIQAILGELSMFKRWRIFLC